jgi:hypothetical protein
MSIGMPTDCWKTWSPKTFPKEITFIYTVAKIVTMIISLHFSHRQATTRAWAGTKNRQGC